METQNKNAFTKKQKIGFTIISIILATTTIALLFATPNTQGEYPTLESLHNEAELLREDKAWHESEIVKIDLQIEVKQAEYDLLYYLANPADFQ